MTLTNRQRDHLQRIKQYFDLKVSSKYVKGAEEHGGDLQDMTNLNLLLNAIDENIDQFTYLVTLLEKL